MVDNEGNKELFNAQVGERLRRIVGSNEVFAHQHGVLSGGSQ